MSGSEIRSFLFVFVVLASCALFGQSPAPELHRIQTVAEGIRSHQHAHQAALILRTRPGVMMCRVDYNTRNILMHVKSICDMDSVEMNQLLAPLDVSVYRFQRTFNVNAPYRHLNPRQPELLPAGK